MRYELVVAEYRGGKIFLNGATIHATIEANAAALYDVYSGKSAELRMAVELKEMGGQEKVTAARVQEANAPDAVNTTDEDKAMGMWSRVKGWLGIAQKEADDIAHKVGDAAVTVGKKVDAVAKQGSQAIQSGMKKVDEVGAKIGGPKGEANKNFRGRDLK